MAYLHVRGVECGFRDVLVDLFPALELALAQEASVALQVHVKVAHRLAVRG